MIIIVDVSYIGIYRGFIDRLYLIDEIFLKVVILLIDIEVVLFKEVIGYEDVFLFIVVDVINSNVEFKVNDIIVNFCFFIYIYKSVFLILYEFIVI